MAGFIQKYRYENIMKICLKFEGGKEGGGREKKKRAKEVERRE